MTSISMLQDVYCQNQKGLKDFYRWIDAGKLPIETGVRLSQDDLIRNIAAVFDTYLSNRPVDRDPYSARRGFWWSHMLWIFYPHSEFFDVEQYKKFAPDLARDRFYCWLNKYFLLLQIPLGLLLYAFGGWSFVIWGMFVRSVLLWHSTWFINSVTHMWGYRTFETADNSRNLWWAAILTYGEGWHNNHHAHPNVAKAGWRWWEYDPTWWAIWLLNKFGLARKVVMPPS